MTATTHPAEYARTLPSRALSYLNLRSAVEIVVMAAIAATLVAWFVRERYTAALLAAIALITLAGLLIDLPVVNRLIVRNTSYEVTPSMIRIRRGVWVSKDTVVATAQVLNVTVVEGPLLRRFGFAKLRFATIADVQPLGPLALDEARQLRDLVLDGTRSGAHER